MQREQLRTFLWTVVSLVCKHLSWLQALAIFDLVRGNFSNANVFSSTFDNYTEALMEKLPDLHLPVFTEEIGDTWIYGALYGTTLHF